MSADVPSRYRRPRRFFSIPGILIGLILGLAAGLFFTWNLAPVQEYDTDPWQLNAAAKDQYIVAIALNYNHDGDLGGAINRLVSLQLPGDPIQAVADAACRLATTGYVNSSGGLHAVRAMMKLYQLQGRTGCADSLISADSQSGGVVTIELPTSTPTLTPPPSKTPTPAVAFSTATPVLVIVPTVAPQNDFDLISVTPLTCSTDQSGLITVEVYDGDGVTGLPGREIRARWDTGQSLFFTGLKPEKSPAYADFQMEQGKDYIVDMPDHADPLPQPLSAVPCTTSSGERAIISYRVVFRAND